jgi:4-carboxymuconolactone decarboxylase
VGIQMPRLPLAEPDGDAPPLNIFRMIANAESAYRPWLRYSGTLLTGLELDPLLRELAILQVARVMDSPYEWAQHDSIARAVGASDAQVAAVEAGRDEDTCFDPMQALVLRVTRSVVSEGAASEEQMAELAERLGPRQAVELLLVIGNYVAIAMLIASTGLEPEAPVDTDALTGGRDRS